MFLENFDSKLYVNGHTLVRPYILWKKISSSDRHLLLFTFINIIILLIIPIYFDSSSNNLVYITWYLQSSYFDTNHCSNHYTQCDSFVCIFLWFHLHWKVNKCIFKVFFMQIFHQLLLTVCLNIATARELNCSRINYIAVL